MIRLLKRIKKALWEVKRFGGFFYRAAQELYKAGWKRRNARYIRYRRHTKIDENLVLFEAFLGRGMLCGPYALFYEMLNNPDYKQFRFVWVLDDFKYHADLIQRYKAYKNIRFVKYMGRRYLKELCRAKYLINNTTFASFFTKREQQVYINTWHGIPLKNLGFDMPNGASETSNIIRNFLQVDYLISANPFLTEIYKNAYKLDGIFEGAIIEEGYPRLDTLVRSRQEDVAAALTSLGIHIEPNKKIILYAPTWKETAKDPRLVLDEYREIKQRMEQEAPQYQVLIKAHQFVYKLIRDCAEVDYIIPATIDANDVLPLADILVSDYSSIFFDYLYFERPILFYIPDLQSYKEYRGLYFAPEQLPGPCSENLDEVIGWIKSIDLVSENYRSVVRKAKEWSCCSGAGQISARILDVVIRGHEEGHHLIKGLGRQKQKILIHRGRMLVNGISTAFLNLLKLIDLEKFDVSIVVTSPRNSSEKKLIESIDPKIRILMRKTTFNFTFFSNVRNRMMNAYGLDGFMKRIWPKRLFKDEVRRCFGDASFDVAVDFEGYALGYALIIAAIPNATHAIWQHNDMLAEYNARFPYLKNVFSAYPLFDKVVSCSKAIMEVNRENLATNETRDKFVYTKNGLDQERVLALAEQKEVVQIYGAEHLMLSTTGNGLLKNAKLIALESQESGTEGQAPLLRFVAVGRLSPEKNYLNLIAAFREFTDQGYDAVLYILGEGPQRKAIEKQIRKLNMQAHVVLVGNIPNPFVVMKHCDCFVLASLHEGQPMVIHEARILNMPIIMTEFSSAAGSKIPHGQYMVESSAEGICDGLVAFAEGKVPRDYRFDGGQYNKEAYAEFLKALDL